MFHPIRWPCNFCLCHSLSMLGMTPGGGVQLVGCDFDGRSFWPWGLGQPLNWFPVRCSKPCRLEQVKVSSGSFWYVLNWFNMIQYMSEKREHVCTRDFLGPWLVQFLSCSFLETFCDMGRNGCTGMRIVYKQQHFDQGISVLGCLFVCVCVSGVNPCFQGIYEFLSFSVLRLKARGASSPSSLAPTKTLDECWWYLTWSVRRTCHETISIFEFCDSLTAATVLIFSFLNMFGYNGLSRANSLN